MFRAYRVASQPARQAGRHVWVRRVCANLASDECGVRCARAGGERRATARTSSATATPRSAVCAERRDGILRAEPPKLVVESESEPTPG